MKVLADLLSTLNWETQVSDIRQGPHWTAVLTRRCGLASTPHGQEHPHIKAPVSDAGHLMDKRPHELAQMAYSQSPLEAAIGMAAINSLLDVDEGRCQVLNAGDLLAEQGFGKKIAIIGHFPFLPKLRQVAKELWVIEKQPGEGELAETHAEGLIPEADVIGLTGSAFINHTIEHLLQLCSPKSYVVVLGATTPLSPVLFDYGVDAISGTIVVDPELVLRSVSQGGIFTQIRGVRILTMKR